MAPHRLLLVACVGEGALALAALAWIEWRDLAVARGPGITGAVAGVAAAAALAAGNFWLLTAAPDVAPVRSVRRLYLEVLAPLFARVRVIDVALISGAAGLCEELFFRGAVQAEWGLWPASVLFGVMHLGGGGTLAFGVWVAIMGAALGGLAIWSGGLLAPIVAHALYDAAAIAYIRWGRS